MNKAELVEEALMEESCVLSNSMFYVFTLRLRGISVLMFAAYFWDGEGLTDRNVLILEQIYALVPMLRKPFIMFCDANMLP